MTPRDHEALEYWQMQTEGIAERKLSDLANTVDDLTTLAHSRAGAHALLAGRPALVEALRKLRDLVLETAPAQAAE